MNPVGKALWFVESHLDSELSLDEVASVSGMSRYHLTRAFGDSLGIPLMRYARGRRLTEAARKLASGAPDILAIALEAGYSSHEAFTRAFREQFGITPEAVRMRGNLDQLRLLEPIRMEQNVLSSTEKPRIIDGPVLLIAGLSERYDCNSSAAIPSQWQRFVPHIGHVPGQVGGVAYGVRWNSDDEGNFDYVCGVEVRDFTRLAPEFGRVRIPAQRYAVFTHRDHISTIRSTWATVWDKWLPEAGLEVADAATFERYGEEFDGRTGMGGVGIWVPLKD